MEQKIGQIWPKLNIRKTEYLTTDAEASGSIQIERTELRRTKAFRYLGTKIEANGNTNQEVTAPYQRRVDEVACGDRSDVR